MYIHDMRVCLYVHFGILALHRTSWHRFHYSGLDSGILAAIGASGLGFVHPGKDLSIRARFRHLGSDFGIGAGIRHVFWLPRYQCLLWAGQTLQLVSAAW